MSTRAYAIGSLKTMRGRQGKHMDLPFYGHNLSWVLKLILQNLKVGFKKVRLNL